MRRLKERIPITEDDEIVLDLYEKFWGKIIKY